MLIAISIFRRRISDFSGHVLRRLRASGSLRRMLKPTRSRPRRSDLRSLLFTGALCCATACASGATGASAAKSSKSTPAGGVPPELAEHPRAADSLRGPLVVSIVIDQLGSSTLTRLEPLLEADGAYARARAHGRIYSRVVYPFVATLTAPGHAAIYSGAMPAESGITANSFFDRASDTRLAFVDDGVSTVLGVPDEHASPARMLAMTVGDALKQATGGRGKVVSLSMKDRSAILPAGKRPDRVLWFETSLRGFTTSSYYASALPEWLVAYTAAHPLDLALTWTVPDEARVLAVQGPDDAPGEGPPPGLGATFPHLLANAKDPASTWLLFPQSTDALLDLALTASEQEQLCNDDAPDLLAISISGTDLVGHAFGPSSWEYADALRRADQSIARLIEKLEARCRVSVLITSDHGVAPLPEQNGGKRIAGNLAARMESLLDSALGKDAWIAGFDPPYLYLTAKARARSDVGKARALIVEELRRVPGVSEGIDTHDIAKLEARGDVLGQQALLSIHPQVSGDVLVISDAFAIPDFGGTARGTTHGSPYAYDTEVPVLVWGEGISPARQLEAFDQRRVASTLAALLHVPAPHPHAPAPLPGVE